MILKVFCHIVDWNLQLAKHKSVGYRIDYTFTMNDNPDVVLLVVLFHLLLCDLLEFV